jgi:heme exporter protein C
MSQRHEALARPRWLRMLGLSTLILFGVGAYLALAVSPPDVNQGQLIRMMYAHVSVAWVCFVAVIVTALYGMAFLWRGRPVDDARAVANAEIATFFAALTLVSGMTYSKPTLNTWWTWDAKLTLTALMFALLVGYFVVRGLIDDPTRRGRVSAVIGIIVAVSLPFNYLAAAWFRTLHPTLSVAVTGVTMAPVMLAVLLFNVGVAALVYLTFVSERVRIARLEHARMEARERREGDGATGEVVRV